MPTKTIIFLSATFGILILIVAAIIFTVILTGNRMSKEEKQNENRYQLYLKEIDKYICPKCGSKLEILIGENQQTFFRCKNHQHCDYVINPDELLKKGEK